MRRLSIARTAAAVVLGFVMVAGNACAARTRPVDAPTTPRTETVLFRHVGLASYYGPGFHGGTTASGAIFNEHQLVAAHPTFPFGTLVRVRCLETGRSVIVEIVDRGPVAAIRAEGVVIDLSEGAARRLRMLKEGRAHVTLEVLKWGRGR